MEIECASVVSKVVVHARGALVTREVTLPDELPSGVIDLAVPGITLGAQAGSVRAALEESERVVSAVRSSIVVPSAEHRPGPSVTKVKDLTARKQRLEDELNLLNVRRSKLSEVALTPALRPHDSSKRERDALDVRFDETLAMVRLLSTKTTELDERILRLERERRELSRELEAARLDDAQTSSRERMGTESPLRRVVVRVIGSGAAGKLSVTYAVGAARWWPTYTLRIEDNGDRATWAFEALVAQRTGEDWAAALLALSSADLVFDARLPELPSLRFGRAQPPKKRPMRPAPAGVDEMFAAYLAFRPVPAPPMPAPRPPASAPMPSEALADEDEDITAVHQFQQQETKKRQAVRLSASFGAVPPAPGGGAPPPQGAPMPPARMLSPAMPMSMAAPLAERASARAFSLRGAAADAFDGGAAEMNAYAYEGEPEEPELVAGAQWNDLDTLVLAGPGEVRRGRLVPQVQSYDSYSLERTAHAFDSIVKARWLDPGESRGMFDHRYEAAGRADVPSDGRVHRVGVATMPCHVLISWRTVPSESPEVYREANVINPFDQALLGGPVDVYLDGSLLAETRMDRIDRGGTLWCGMGVDDRVKVARNVRVDEESAGLLGGSLAVTHTVGIELSSTIKDPIKVVVLERIPVTDDKNIEVKVLKSTPQPSSYDQSERGSPVRGGCRFEATVNPGKKLPLEIVYRLVFASKLDIVGGSRRG